MLAYYSFMVFILVWVSVSEPIPAQTKTKTKESLPEWKKGDLLTHRTLGNGRVTIVGDDWLSVEFFSGRKFLDLNVAPIERVPPFP